MIVVKRPVLGLLALPGAAAVTALLILLFGCSSPSELETKVKEITEAANAFVVLAEGSAMTGEAPRRV